MLPSSVRHWACKRISPRVEDPRCALFARRWSTLALPSHGGNARDPREFDDPIPINLEDEVIAAFQDFRRANRAPAAPQARALS